MLAPPPGERLLAIEFEQRDTGDNKHYPLQNREEEPHDSDRDENCSADISENLSGSFGDCAHA
jgi:hypothetical protein